MNSFSRRDIFKKRKNKAYKNLVSYGQYGVLTALSLASIATGGLVQAETATNSPETVLTAPTVEAPVEEVATSTAVSEDVASQTSSEATVTEAVSEVATPVSSESQVSSESAVATSESATVTSQSETTSQTTSETASNEATTSDTPASEAAESLITPVAATSGTTFSWQAVPEASSLLSNGSELLASGATISYKQTPVYGQTSAVVVVVYADGKSVAINVPIKVTANAVRKTLAAAVEEGSGTRAVATSPNTSGTVSGSLTSQSATSNLKVIDTVNQTTVLDISGDAANYSGGYLEVRITNGSSLDVTPSPLTGVTATKSYDGNDAVIKYTFGPSGLNGGAYYSLKFSYKFKSVDNWGNVVDDLNDNDFNIVTTSNFYD